MSTSEEKTCCPICGQTAKKVRRVLRAGKVGVCENCRGWYRVPRPSASDLQSIYTKEYYDSWRLDENSESLKATKHATFTPLLNRITNALSADNAKTFKILDVGAATGMLLDVAARTGWEPHAIELNPYSAGVLREKFGSENVFEGELTDYPESGDSFDAITMTDVIEHVLDIHATLGKAATLLKDRGVLCLTTPRIDSFSRVVLGAQWLHFKEEHIQYFSRSGIVQTLEKAGFEDINVCGHYKYLSITYVHQQLQAFPHKLLTPVIAAMHKIMPKSLRNRPLRFRCGEMLVIARRVSRK